MASSQLVHLGQFLWRPELGIDRVLMCCSVLNADSSDPLSVSMTGIDTELRR